ncbi:ROK family protein [Virgibacillus halophilus]|uniref:ROK family protein n=1 Tax=Tigheibacillus halophilus TaxID=361280 RepID=UPI00363BFA21
MVTGDGAYIKKINRSLILQKIMEHEFISRAELAKITGLNKATISVQVADLLDEDLIYETQQEHNAIGRRPIMLSIDEDTGFILGIDLDYKHIQFAVSNLKGNIVESKSIDLTTDDYEEIIALLVEQISAYQKKYAFSRYGLVNAIIGVHGTVNKEEMIYFIPKYKWQHKDMKTDLKKQLDLDIFIENNANLSSLAEKVYQYHHSSNLMTIILRSGIGAGMMVDGKLDRGYHGYAGEMGHMIILPNGKPCNCGNHGCWELYAAEPQLFATLSEKLGRSIENYDDIEQLIAKNDPAANELLHTFIFYLAVGLNNVINLYNPETLVLNSRVLELYPNAIAEIKSHLHSNVSQYGEIALSKLGSQACMMGACAFGIQLFLEFSELYLATKPIAIQQIKEDIS